MSGEIIFKSCPFCGESENILEKDSENGELLFWIECGACHVTTDIETTPEKACKTWNRRSTPPGLETVPEGTMDVALSKRTALGMALRLCKSMGYHGGCVDVLEQMFDELTAILTRHRATQDGK